MTTPSEFRDVSLAHLTNEILRDLARNESSQHAWRKAAVEFLLDRKSPYAQHPDLNNLLQAIKTERVAAMEHAIAKDEVQAVVEAAIEAPLDEIPQPGPFVASFTTKNL